MSPQFFPGDPLAYFGFDGSNKWKSHHDALISTFHRNLKARSATRVVQFGSLPLFDGVVFPAELAAQVKRTEEALRGTGIPVTVSELACGHQAHESEGSLDVLDAIDAIDIHMLRILFSGDQAAQQFLRLLLLQDTHLLFEHFAMQSRIGLLGGRRSCCHWWLTIAS